MGVEENKHQVTDSKSKLMVNHRLTDNVTGQRRQPEQPEQPEQPRQSSRLANKSKQPTTASATVPDHMWDRTQTRAGKDYFITIVISLSHAW